MNFLRGRQKPDRGIDAEPGFAGPQRSAYRVLEDVLQTLGSVNSEPRIGEVRPDFTLTKGDKKYAIETMVGRRDEFLNPVIVRHLMSDQPRLSDLGYKAILVTNQRISEPIRGVLKVANVQVVAPAKFDHDSLLASMTAATQLDVK